MFCLFPLWSRVEIWLAACGAVPWVRQPHWFIQLQSWLTLTFFDARATFSHRCYKEAAHTVDFHLSSAELQHAFVRSLEFRVKTQLLSSRPNAFLACATIKPIPLVEWPESHLDSNSKMADRKREENYGNVASAKGGIVAFLCLFICFLTGF